MIVHHIHIIKSITLIASIGHLNKIKKIGLYSIMTNAISTNRSTHVSIIPVRYILYMNEIKK